MRIKGNLRSTTNPEIEVLGFFNASAVKSKRIFIEKVKDFEVFYPECEPRALGVGDLKEGTNPKYLISIDGNIKFLIDRCVECTRLGGSTVKPDYWPN